MLVLVPYRVRGSLRFAVSRNRGMSKLLLALLEVGSLLGPCWVPTVRDMSKLLLALLEVGSLLGPDFS